MYVGRAVPLTGHHRDAIFGAVKEGAAASRAGERRDWDAYARRAVDFAFGVSGSQLAQVLEPRRERLLRIEGRQLEVAGARAWLTGPLALDFAVAR